MLRMCVKTGQDRPRKGRKEGTLSFFVLTLFDAFRALLRSRACCTFSTIALLAFLLSSRDVICAGGEVTLQVNTKGGGVNGERGGHGQISEEEEHKPLSRCLFFGEV